MSNANEKGLGRGLDALLGEDDDFDFISKNENSEKKTNTIDINLLYPSPLQPRKDFDEEALNSLVDSIREKGVLQPLLVRKNGNKYEIIAGERRYRASKVAGLKELPVIIKDISDKEALEIALIENLLRENLSAIEEAEGFERLIMEFSHTQDALSKVVGKSRSQISNTLRLLTLPETVKDMVRENKLSAGHARALVGLNNAEELAKKILKEDLNVRQVEKLVAKQKNLKPSARIAKTKSPELVNIERYLFDAFGLKVEINNGKNNSGVVSIKYDSIDELEHIINILERRV